MSERCIFCEIVEGRLPASVVYEDELTMAFIDTRQFHPGHTLVIPKQHFADVRELDADTGAALMSAVSLVTRAVGEAFPNEGLNLWSSIGPAGGQEVSHLHIHVHPRRTGDGMFHIYPSLIPPTDQETRDSYAARIREHLYRVSGTATSSS